MTYAVPSVNEGASRRRRASTWRATASAPAARATLSKTGLILVADADAPETAERWTFAELDDAVRRVAAGLLAAGIRPGERLVIALPNTSDYLLLFFGAIAAGIVPLPASSLLTPAELAFLIADAEPAAVAVAGRAGHPGAGRCPRARRDATSPRSAPPRRSPPTPTPRPTTRRS